MNYEREKHDTPASSDWEARKHLLGVRYCLGICFEFLSYTCAGLRFRSMIIDLNAKYEARFQCRMTIMEL